MFYRTSMFCYYKTKVAPTWSAERSDASQGQGQMHYLQVSDGRWSATHSYVSVYTNYTYIVYCVSLQNISREDDKLLKTRVLRLSPTSVVG